MAAKRVLIAAAVVIVLVASARVGVAWFSATSLDQAETLGDYLASRPSTWNDQPAVEAAATRLDVPILVAHSFPTSGQVTITSALRQTSACLRLPRGETTEYIVDQGHCTDDLVG